MSTPTSSRAERRGGFWSASDRGAWVRLLVAALLGVVAALSPHLPTTAAEFTQTESTTSTLRTSDAFDAPVATPVDPPVDAPIEPVVDPGPKPPAELVEDEPEPVEPPAEPVDPPADTVEPPAEAPAETTDEPSPAELVLAP